MIVNQDDGSVMVVEIGECYVSIKTGETLGLLKEIQVEQHEVNGKFDNNGLERWKDLSWNFHKEYKKV